MSTFPKRDYSATCSKLNDLMVSTDYKIRVTKANKATLTTNEKTIEEMNLALKGCELTLRKLKPYMVAVQDYLAEKRANSLQSINNAIRLADEVIPDAAVGGQFNLEGRAAWLSTSDELDMQVTEGGGYRNTLSAFLRLVVVAANPDLLSTVFLDEVGATVSQGNSTTLSSYLNFLSNKMQIISIEQKPEMYSNIENLTMYLFEKGDEYSVVTLTKQPQEVTDGL